MTHPTTGDDRIALPPLSDVTVLLSLTVFMNLVSAIMPTTSEAVPLIGRPTWQQLQLLPLPHPCNDERGCCRPLKLP